MPSYKNDMNFILKKKVICRNKTDKRNIMKVSISCPTDYV